MKTINATLLTAQKNPNSQAIARASLADNGALHLADHFTSPWSGGLTHAVNCGTFITRIRSVPVGTKVQYQKITDPTVESQWETWTDLDTNNASLFSLGLFWTGTYVVACYQDATSLEVKWRRSTDAASWDAEQTAYSLTPYIAYFSGVSGGSAQSGLMLSYNTQLYWAAYNPATNTWTALNSAGLTMTSSVVEGHGFYDSANSRHVFLYAPNGQTRWSRFGLVVQTRSTAGTWGTPRVYHQSDNLGCRFISASQIKINGYWWVTFTRETGWGSGYFWLARSDDGVHWEAPIFTDIDVNGHANIIDELTGYTGHYVATEANSRKTPAAYTYWSNLPVVRYKFTAGSLTERTAGGRAPHLTVTIDNRDGAATTPRLYAKLTLERGFRVAGTDYYVSAGVYWVTGFRYLQDDQLLEIEAIDTLGLLTTWLADSAFNFENETIEDQVELICALAGAHAVSFDGSTLWAESAHLFTHPAGQTARDSLRALHERVPFDVYVGEDGTLNFYLPAASPSVDYTYGRSGGNHTYWPGEFGQADTPNYTRVVGQPVRTIAGESADQNRLYESGRRRTHLVIDNRVRSVADADALTAAYIVFQSEQAKAGYFEAPPNFALEVGDVLEFDSGHYNDTAGPWRVEQIAEEFNGPTSKKFVQRIHLRGTT